jgi:hypothetical protein
VFGTLAGGVLAWTLWTGQWTGWSFTHPFWATLLADPVLRLLTLGGILGVGVYGHFTIRHMATKHLITRLQREARTLPDGEFLSGVTKAFRRSTRWWRSVFCKRPAGWGHRAQRLLKEVLTEANYCVQELNNTFTNPSGTRRTTAKSAEDATVTEKVSAP